MKVGRVLVATWLIVIKNYINTLEIILPFQWKIKSFLQPVITAILLDQYQVAATLVCSDFIFIYYFFMIPILKKRFIPKEVENRKFFLEGCPRKGDVPRSRFKEVTMNVPDKELCNRTRVVPVIPYLFSFFLVCI